MYEDDHLLAVNKPAGWNTHAPDPWAGEGVFDWLRHREPRWAELAILQRLDKETSGLLVFGKTPCAHRSLAEQFHQRKVGKEYVLLTDRPVPAGTVTARSALVRAGERYLCRAPHAGAPLAETTFEAAATTQGRTVVVARPRTGKTHQIRAQAAAHGFPILGDTLYGGTPAARMHLHAASLSLLHPVSGRPLTLRVPAEWAADPRIALREAIIAPDETDAFRLAHGAADGCPGWYVDRLGETLRSQGPGDCGREQWARLTTWQRHFACRHAFHQRLERRRGGAPRPGVAPLGLTGGPPAGDITVRENGVRYALRLWEGPSVGLFLDQRDNRRRLLTRRVGVGFDLGARGRPDPPWQVLNLFAHTCGFSLCAALAGAQTTSVDLSHNYLEWGRENFRLNGLDPGGHEFARDDALDRLHRLARQGRAFDLVVLDPPTFSTSKTSGVFQAEKHYARLVGAALPVLKAEGVLFASTNAAGLKPGEFLDVLGAALRAARRPVLQQHYAPQPPDFPISREEPAYLKTVWLRVG